MPIYEYRCTACGHELESLQKFTDSPLRDCPACGKGALSKLLSVAGFQLKGSGWYVTDFKGSGSKPAAKPAADNGGESKPAESKPGESKPAETKSAPEGDSKSASAGEAATAAAPPAATTAPTAKEQ